MKQRNQNIKFAVLLYWHIGGLLDNSAHIGVQFFLFHRTFLSGIYLLVEHQPKLTPTLAFVGCPVDLGADLGKKDTHQMC